jgi:ATP-dependent DNA helicase RecQ
VLRGQEEVLLRAERQPQQPARGRQARAAAAGARAMSRGPEAMEATEATGAAAPAGGDGLPADFDPALFQRLRALRLELAREAGVPAYVVFHDATLRAIAAAPPRDLRQLATIPGIGEKKLERYGQRVMHCLRKESGASDPGAPLPT